jgi:cytoskeletal protein RodZ
MVENVGYKLQQARVQRGLSIEDAARATKMRPDRIRELEEDDLTNFPNLAYARGFLLIYARFLNVDVSDYANALESGQAGMDDYEYLANARMPTRERIVRRTPKRSPAPLFALIAVLAAAGIGWYFVLNFKRLGDIDQLAAKSQTPATTPAVAPSPALIAPVPTPTPPAITAEALSRAGDSMDAVLEAVPATSPEAALPETTPALPAPAPTVTEE